MMPDDALLERYIAGLCSPLERSHVESWAARDPGVAAVLHAARMKGALLDMPTRRIDVERGVARMWAMTSEAQQREETTLAGLDADRSVIAQRDLTPRDLTSPDLAPMARPPKRWVRWSVAGAAGALATAAAIAVTVRARLQTPGFHAPHYVTYATRPNQRAVITLRDGTHVQLDVASRLDVPSDFGRDDRSVRLVGHATFAVSHHDAAPFIVETRETRATVLGTAFSVRAYESVSPARPADVRVAVQSGKVAMQACELATTESPCVPTARQTVLAANDVGVVTASRHVAVVRDTSVDADFAFISGRLLLDGASLGRLVPDLERWYDVDIRLADPSLADRALGGWLSQGTSEDLAQYLTGALHVRVEREGRVMTIYTGAR